MVSIRYADKRFENALTGIKHTLLYNQVSYQKDINQHQGCFAKENSFSAKASYTPLNAQELFCFYC